MEQIVADSLFYYSGLFLFMGLGVSLGLLGSGGALIAYPILTFFLALSPLMATSYSLYVVNAVSLVGLFLKRKEILFKESLIFIIPSILGVYLSRYWLFNKLPEVLYQSDSFTLEKNSVIEIGMYLFMVAAGLSLLRKKRIKSQQNDAQASNQKNARLYWVVFYSFVVGVVTGIFGVGGGFLIIPVLIHIFQMSFKQATITSLLIIVINTSVGILTDIAHGFFLDFKLLFKLIIIGMLGLSIGVVFSKKLKTETLQKIFALLMSGIGAGVLCFKLPLFH